MDPLQAQESAVEGHQPERSIADATREWRSRHRLRRLIQEGRLSEALNSANSLIEEDPTNRNAWHEKATAQFFLHDYDAAQDSYDALLRFDNNDHYALTGKGLCFCDTNDYESALRYFQRAADLAPEDAIVWEQMGRAYAALDDHQAAAEALRKAISIDDRFVEAWHWLGQALQALGRYSEALRCFDVALYYDSENADAWNDRGTLFLTEFNRLVGAGGAAARYRIALLREAMRDFDCAIALKPDHANATDNMKQLKPFDSIRVLETLETPVGLGLFDKMSREVPQSKLAIDIQDGVARIPTTRGWITVQPWYPASTEHAPSAADQHAKDAEGTHGR